MTVTKASLLCIILSCLCDCRFTQAKNTPVKNAILENIEIDNLKREYFVYLPKKKLLATEKLPLLLMLHGRFGSARVMMEGYSMNAIADREGFAIVYPDGYDRSWADGRGGTPADKNNIDDVKFIESVIQIITAKYPIDSQKVFITGHSNGGFMTQRMLIEKTNLFKAGVSVTAHISVNVLKKSSPQKPISVAFISGTEDPLVPYDGGYVIDGEEVLGAEDSVNRWVIWNSCSKQGLIETFDKHKDETKLEIHSYTNCKDSVTVQLYKIIDGGHIWPGLAQQIPFINLGKPTQELDASEVVWAFFKNQL